MNERDTKNNTAASGVSLTGERKHIRLVPVNYTLIKAALSVSALAFWLLIGLFWTTVGINMSYMICCAFLGALSAFAFSRVRIVRMKPLSMITGAVFSGAVCFLAFRLLCSKLPALSDPQTGLSGFIGAIVPNGSTVFLKYSGLVLAVLSFPFIFYISSYIVDFFVSMCGKDSVKHLLRTFRTVSIRSAAVTHLIFLANIAAAVITGIILLCAVYAIPTAPIDRNVALSASVMDEEGEYPHVISWCFSQSDNAADSVMLLEAADASEGTLLERALLNKRGYVASEDVAHYALVEHYCNGAPFDGETSYARYWHGYLLFIKPLFYFTGLSTVRMINGIAQLTLAVLLCVTLAKKRRKGLIAPFIITYLMMKPVLLAHCFEFSLCYYIIVIGSIVLLSVRGITEGRRAALLFLNIGIAVGFFDFLTYPSAAFGIPAVIYLSMFTGVSLSEKMLKIFKAGYSFLFGYAVMWISKWIIGTAFTDNNVLADGLRIFLFRISGQTNAADAAISSAAAVPTKGALTEIISCWVKNLTCFFDDPFIALFIVFMVIIIIRIRKSGELNAEKLRRILAPYVFLAAVPVLWYTFARNHSSIHFWFTNKALALTVMAAMAGAAEILKNRRVENGGIPAVSVSDTDIRYK